MLRGHNIKLDVAAKLNMSVRQIFGGGREGYQTCSVIDKQSEMKEGPDYVCNVQHLFGIQYKLMQITLRKSPKHCIAKTIANS